jgi:hypothetical protein
MASRRYLRLDRSPKATLVELILHPPIGRMLAVLDL